MIVVISAEAEADIEAIGDYIAKDNPARALSFMRNLHEKCLQLADTPETFSFVPHFERRGVRRRVHGNYLIFYRVEEARLVILHVLHGARDYGAILFPDDSLEP